MKIRSPSLVELHAFLAVCQRGSFRSAAVELCVTQAAISRAIQRLEEHLACGRLFERTSAGVSMTPRGEQLRKLTERHVRALESAAQAMQHLTPPKLVRLSVIPTLGIQWLMPRLPLFSQLHPHIEVELRQFRHDEDFKRDDVDLWIEVKRPARRWPDHIQATYLLGRELIPVCSPQLATHFRTPSDLKTAPLLHHTNFPDNWKRWFTEAGIPFNPSLGPGFDLTMNLIVAAKAGLGVAVVPGCLAQRELQNSELICPFDIPVSCGRGYYLCTNRDEPTFSARDKFAQWLLEQARQDHSSSI